MKKKLRSENKAFDKLKNEIAEQQSSVWEKEAFFCARESFRDNLVQQKEMIMSQAQRIE